MCIQITKTFLLHKVENKKNLKNNLHNSLNLIFQEHFNLKTGLIQGFYQELYHYNMLQSFFISTKYYIITMNALLFKINSLFQIIVEM